MEESKIKQQSIILAFCLLLLNLITGFYLRNSDLSSPLLIAVGVALLNRIVALGYLFSIAKKIKEDLAFNTTVILIFPIIGLFFIRDLTQETKNNQPAEEESVDSVNNDAVLDELIERLNSKK